MARNPDFRQEAKQLLTQLDALGAAAQSAPPEPNLFEIPGPIHDFYATLNAGVAGLLRKYSARPLPNYRVMGIPTKTYAELFGHAYNLINELHAKLDKLRGKSLSVHYNPLPEPGDSPGREYWIMQKKHAKFALRFNLEYPLEPQLVEAGKRLREGRDRLRQQAQIKPITNRALLKKAELYRTYLRLLDANASGASVRKMAQVLFPGRENKDPDYMGDRAVRYALKAAKKLRDGEYRNLPLLEK